MALRGIRLRGISRISLRARVLVIAAALLVLGQALSGLLVIGALEQYLVGRIDGQFRPAAGVAARTAEIFSSSLPIFSSSVPRGSSGNFLLGNYRAVGAILGRVGVGSMMVRRPLWFDRRSWPGTGGGAFGETRSR